MSPSVLWTAAVLFSLQPRAPRWPGQPDQIWIVPLLWRGILTLCVKGMVWWPLCSHHVPFVALLPSPFLRGWGGNSHSIPDIGGPQDHSWCDPDLWGLSELLVGGQRWQPSCPPTEISLCWILFGPQVAACSFSLDFKLGPTKKLRFPRQGFYILGKAKRRHSQLEL